MGRKKRDSAAAYTRYTQEDFNSLLEVGLTLSSEKDPQRIMDCILQKMLDISEADGASIYLVEKVKTESGYEEKLRFNRMTNRHTKATATNRLLEINSASIAGYVALSGKTVKARDVYLLKEDSPFKFFKTFDEESNYRTKSVLAVPIRNAQGKTLGVLQLVNKLRAEFLGTNSRIKKPPEKSIIAFSEYDEKLLQGFASQAAIAIDNSKLTRSINNLFESFVQASVTAIEARDPSTSGHSGRVADLTVSLAQAIDQIQMGPFAKIAFNAIQYKELRYAALLHDFGKIGVRENILLKSKKLFPHELETIMLRLQSLELKNETQIWKHLVRELTWLIQEGTPTDLNELIKETEQNVQRFNQKIHFMRENILQANEPQILSGDFNIEKLLTWLGRMSDQLGQTVLTYEESRRLSIGRGTLSSSERKEIESHVSHTFTFLSQIAWTEDLEGIPHIAHCHHEKIDGTGYPRGLKGDDIPIQARMMTICDIFDALTAMDRPYKKAVTSERAIDILYLEANEGKLDKELLKVFVEAQVFRISAQSTKKAA